MEKYELDELITLEVKEYDNYCDDCFFNNTNIVDSCYRVCDFKLKFVVKKRVNND